MKGIASAASHRGLSSQSITSEASVLSRVTDLEERNLKLCKMIARKDKEISELLKQNCFMATALKEKDVPR